jgi:endonuclease G, mitochondrial
MKLKAIFGAIFGLLIVVAIAAGCFWLIGKFSQSSTVSEPQNSNSNTIIESVPDVKSEHLALGNPSNATVNPTKEENYLIVGQHSVVSYNRKKGIVNWVSWKLQKSDFGAISRQNDFRPDDRLPIGWKRLSSSDYSNSGFDRGHMCPSGDRSSSIDANSSTFLMTNITPQSNDLNTGPWEKFESFSRGLVFKQNNVYIIAGQYGEKGKYKNRFTIPTNFWKVVVAVPKNFDVNAINGNTKVYAVDMPNIDGIADHKWPQYQTSVREIEHKTGYNFLSKIPQHVQDQIETKIVTQ